MIDQANNKKIEKAIELGLKEPTFDLAQDYSELGLDSFLDNEIIKEIPVVKTIVGVIKGGGSN